MVGWSKKQKAASRKGSAANAKGWVTKKESGFRTKATIRAAVARVRKVDKMGRGAEGEARVLADESSKEAAARRALVATAKLGASISAGMAKRRAEKKGLPLGVAKGAVRKSSRPGAWALLLTSPPLALATPPWSLGGVAQLFAGLPGEC